METSIGESPQVRRRLDARKVAGEWTNELQTKTARRGGNVKVAKRRNRIAVREIVARGPLFYRGVENVGGEG